jgi:putative transport protein
MKNTDPSIGYSIAYPFGVIVPILCIDFMTRQVQPNSRRNGKVSTWPR